MTVKQLLLPANRAFDSNGRASPSAVASLYATGTLTPEMFYADSALTTPLGTTLTANGSGKFAIAAYQDGDTAFRLIITDATGAQLDDIDPFYFGIATSSTDTSPRRLSFGARSFIHTERQAVAAFAGIADEIVGFAKTAGTTGGATYPVYYVNNASLETGTLYSFGWALAQAAAAGGGQIYFDPDPSTKFDVILLDDLVITQSNVTLYAPGCNVTIWQDRLDGHVNITSGSNWIIKGIVFRPLGGPINGTAIGEGDSHAVSIINIHADASDKFAFINCEIRHPSWHCLDITRNTASTGQLCRVSIINCIMWDSIQSHLIGTDNASLASADYTTNASPRYTFVTFYRTGFLYNLQRNPKVLGNGYVDMVDCYTLVRPYETEYVDRPDLGKTYTDIETDAWGAGVQEGGWLRVRGCLFSSAHPASDAMPATETIVGIGGATGRISVQDSAAENSMTFAVNEDSLIDPLPYTLVHTPVPAAGPAREAWVADFWSTAGARPDPAPEGVFVWTTSTSAYPNGTSVLVERGKRDEGRWLRIDSRDEYPTLARAAGGVSDGGTSRSYTRNVGFTLGKTTQPAIGATSLDLASLDSRYFIAQGNGAPANVLFLMTTGEAAISDGQELYLSGSSTNPVTLKNANSIVSSVAALASDTITVTAHGMSTGDWPIYFTAGTTMPGGLVSKQPYYAIKVDANTLKVAASYADALAGTAVDITSAAVGTLTAFVGNISTPNGLDLTISSSSRITHMVWDAVAVRWNFISRHYPLRTGTAAVATDAATTMALANDIRAALVTLGLIS